MGFIRAESQKFVPQKPRSAEVRTASKQGFAALLAVSLQDLKGFMEDEKRKDSVASQPPTGGSQKKIIRKKRRPRGVVNVGFDSSKSVDVSSWIGLTIIVYSESRSIDLHSLDQLRTIYICSIIMYYWYLHLIKSKSAKQLLSNS